MISREFSARETSPRHDLPESTGQFPIEEAKWVLALGPKLLMKPDQDRKAWQSTGKMVGGTGGAECGAGEDGDATGDTANYSTL